MCLISSNQPESGAVAVGRLAEALGTANFTVRGETITALAQPHRFYLLQRVQDVFAKLSDEKQTEISTLLEACDMKGLWSKMGHAELTDPGCHALR